MGTAMVELGKVSRRGLTCAAPFVVNEPAP